MSHFTVMVATDTNEEEELQKIMQPYHEYECTGINDEYVVFSPASESMDDLKKKHAEQIEKNPESTSDELEVFVEDWYGYELREGVYGRVTNPNSKWDWWVTGGRWSGYLKLKGGGDADQAVKSDIDFDGMMTDAGIKAEASFDKAQGVAAGRKWVSWVDSRSKYENIDDARDFYNNQNVLVDLRKAHDNNPFMNFDEFLSSREEYVNNEKKGRLATFATIVDGKWAQKGEMGWWACVSDESPSWSDDFLEILKRIPDDKVITVVDCHI